MRRWQKFSITGTLGFQDSVLGMEPDEGNQFSNVWLEMPRKARMFSIANSLTGYLAPYHLVFWKVGGGTFVEPAPDCFALHVKREIIEQFQPTGGWDSFPSIVAAEVFNGFRLGDGSVTDRLIDGQSFFVPGEPGYDE